MLQVLSEFGVNDSKNDWEGLVGECLLVYCRGYIYLRKRDVVCQFGKGIDISYLAEELGTASVSINTLGGHFHCAYLMIAPARENNTVLS